MLFNIKFISNKQLKKLDKELSKINYNELLGGLQELNREIINENPDKKNTEELRAVYAITQCCLELQKIYEEGK